MRVLILSACVILFCIASLICKSQECENLEESTEEIQKEKNIPRYYKRVGDCYASDEVVPKALENYRKALSLQGEGLTIEERIEIADYFGKQDLYEEAISELQKIVDQNPHEEEALILIARFLSWAGKQEAAGKYIDEVLAKDPFNPKALQIKADILNYSKHPNEALAIYEGLLKKKESFEARYGMALAYFNLGERAKAEANIALSQPEFPYQERLKETLQVRIKEENKEVAPVEEKKREIIEESSKAIAEAMAKKIEKQIAKAVEAAQKRCFKEAYALLCQIVELDPKNLEAKTALATILGWDNRYTDSALVLEEIFIIDPSFRDALLVKATHLAIHRSFTCAYQIVYQILEKNPDDVDARIHLARFLIWDERYPDAFVQLDKIIEKEPENGEALILRAAAYAKNRCYNEAFREIDAALEIEPKNVDALLELAILYSLRGCHVEALAVLDYILEINADYYEAKLLKADELFKLGFFEQAICLIHELLVHDNRYIEARLTLSRFLSLLEYYGPAINELDFALSLDPHNQEARLLLADQYAKLRCFRAAYTIVLDLLASDPNNIRAQLEYASYLDLDGRYLQAIDVYNQILLLDPCNVDALVGKATVLRNRKDPRNEGLFLYALDLDPGRFEAQEGLAYSFGQRYHFGAAKLVMDEMVPKSYFDLKELADLGETITPGPNIDLKYLEFRDSDQIVSNTTLLSLQKWIKNWKYTARYRNVRASQPANGNLFLLKEELNGGYAEALNFVNPYWDVGGGVGGVQTSEGNFVVGNARMNFRTNYGLFFLGSEYDVFGETAAAIFFKIRTWANYITYTNIYSGRLSYGGTYSYTKYSDKNHANRIDLNGQYKLYQSVNGYTQVFLNYGVTYWNFALQPISPFIAASLFSGAHGYFDPKRYLSNRLTVNLNYDDKMVYVHLSPYLGYATYHVLGIHYNGPYYVGSGVFGLKVTPRFFIEGIVEAGVYALTHLNYHYTLMGGRVFWAF